MGVGMENPTPVQNFTYLEPDSIISSLFVQSVIFCQSLLNKFKGVESVCGGCGCGFEELWVWRRAFEEVGVGRWVWGGGCEEVGVGRWVWGGGCGYGEEGVGVERWVWL